jgi:hypothetical protein
MSWAFEKTVLQPGTGVYGPNRLATVVTDMTGKWCAPDGSSVEFYKTDGTVTEIGTYVRKGSLVQETAD